MHFRHIFSSPFSAYLSAFLAIIGRTSNVSRLSTNKNSAAIGNAKVNANSAPLPVAIANAVPKIPPDTVSGGRAAPIVIAPINANSSVAPS